MANNNVKQVQKIIDGWQNWGLDLRERPILIEPLTNGLSNQSFLLSLPFNNESRVNKKAVLRLHSSTTLYPIDRAVEKSIHAAVNANSVITPRILFQSDDAQFRITEFIAGKTLAQLVSQSSASSYLPALTHCLNQIHATTIDLPTFDYSAWLNHYYSFLTQANAEQQQTHKAMLSLCADYESQAMATRVLCHHDLNPHNILLPDDVDRNEGANPVVLLDWEFAAAGIASMDFAGLAIELDIALSDVSALSGIAQKELESAARLYRYLCTLYATALTCKPSAPI